MRWSIIRSILCVHSYQHYYYQTKWTSWKTKITLTYLDTVRVGLTLLGLSSESNAHDPTPLWHRRMWEETRHGFGARKSHSEQRKGLKFWNIFDQISYGVKSVQVKLTKFKMHSWVSFEAVLENNRFLPDGRLKSVISSDPSKLSCTSILGTANNNDSIGLGWLIFKINLQSFPLVKRQFDTWYVVMRCFSWMRFMCRSRTWRYAKLY